MSTLDDFESVIFDCLDDGMDVNQLQQWLFTFSDLWTEANSPEGCTCGYIGQCNGCAEEAGDPPYVVTQWDTKEEFELPDLRDVFQGGNFVVSASMEDRLNQIDSLISRLFDEIRDLKSQAAGDRWPEKKTTTTPAFPQQPYQPPMTVPFPEFPHSPFHPWGGGISNCSCLPQNGGSGVCHCVSPHRHPGVSY